MTNQEINIAIAEVCGWSKCYITPNGDVFGIRPDYPDFSNPATYSIPNYCQDLNAMAVAEKSLTPAELIRYTETIADESKFINWGYYPGDAEVDWDELSKLVTVNARNKAISFCRTKGLWKD